MAERTVVHTQAFVYADDPLTVELLNTSEVMIRGGLVFTAHFMAGPLDTATMLRSLAQQAILAADLIAPPLSSEDAQDAPSGPDGLPDVPVAAKAGRAA